MLHKGTALAYHARGLGSIPSTAKEKRKNTVLCIADASCEYMHTFIMEATHTNVIKEVTMGEKTVALNRC